MPVFYVFIGVKWHLLHHVQTNDFHTSFLFSSRWITRKLYCRTTFFIRICELRDFTLLLVCFCTEHVFNCDIVPLKLTILAIYPCLIYFFVGFKNGLTLFQKLTYFQCEFREVSIEHLNECGMSTEDTYMYSSGHLVLSHLELVCVLLFRPVFPKVVAFPTI